MKKEIEIIKLLMKERGVNQAELARQIGMTRNRVGQIIHEQELPGKKAARRLTKWVNPDDPESFFLGLTGVNFK